MMEKRSSIQSELELIGIEEKETPPQNDGVFNGLGQVGILACLCTGWEKLINGYDISKNALVPVFPILGKTHR